MKSRISGFREVADRESVQFESSTQAFSSILMIFNSFLRFFRSQNPKWHKDFRKALLQDSLGGTFRGPVSGDLFLDTLNPVYHRMQTKKRVPAISILKGVPYWNYRKSRDFEDFQDFLIKNVSKSGSWKSAQKTKVDQLSNFGWFQIPSGFRVFTPLVVQFNPLIREGTTWTQLTASPGAQKVINTFQTRLEVVYPFHECFN